LAGTRMMLGMIFPLEIFFTVITGD